MTPEEVFAQLGDLHTPEVETIATHGLDPWPLLAFAAIVLVVAALRVWSRWRRAAAALADVDK